MIITICVNDIKKEFMVNRQQKILDAITIIVENGEMDIQLKGLEYLLSQQKQMQINTQLTFMEAEIYQGDILIIGGKIHE
ncbi:hypothetical protein [Listeria booriae]|uniref:Uncharacterized protein n=1 Tax=Listeria booriae TaxID=1552123 RepID=A0A7X0XZZ5_9LIST|nr:hypothetical protein [Listeria booriae]MBC1794466.1 hypothetical protein [Listeria booriae]MBC1801819.1 hypothetical protein [Listeria booriae]MBC1804066.1 hypothetical protein [Listeria booriae]MBC2037193.1 hypothetical protein [Listeria booriae]MBC2196126.1 hypothetical protein [Listeria booriae]